MMVEHINGIPGPELIHHLFMYNCMYYKVHTKCICTPHKRRHSFTQTSLFRWYHMQFNKIIQRQYRIHKSPLHLKKILVIFRRTWKSVSHYNHSISKDSSRISPLYGAEFVVPFSSPSRSLPLKLSTFLSENIII